jgi:hypothetical protein
MTVMLLTALLILLAANFIIRKLMCGRSCLISQAVCGTTATTAPTGTTGTTTTTTTPAPTGTAPTVP